MSPFGSAAAMSAINFGFSNAQSFVDNLFYKRNLKLQTEAQKELIDYQNEYNSPTAQMQRLMEAGLNPNLVYGSQAPAGVSGNASAPSGAMPQSHTTYDFANSMARIAQMKQAESAVNLNKALTNKANAEADYVRSQDQYYPEYMESVIRKSNQEIFTLASQENLNISQAALNYAEKTLKEAQELYTRGEIDLQTYRKQELVAKVQLLMEQSHTEQTKRAEMQSNIGVNLEQANYYRIQTKLGEIQEAYDRITKSGGQALIHNRLFVAQVNALCNELGITGKKGVIVTNLILDWLNKTQKFNPFNKAKEGATTAATILAL